MEQFLDNNNARKPDIEALDVSARCNTLNDILEVTTKPIIYDADTGGRTEHFVSLSRRLNVLVFLVIIEDKVGLKRIPCSETMFFKNKLLLPSLLKKSKLRKPHK